MPDPQVPDNDDVMAEPLQPDVLANAEAVLANPEAKISDLGDARTLLHNWIAEVRARQAVSKSVEADSGSHSELSPEQERTLATLKSNQEAKEANLRTGTEWTEVEAKLQKSPEKLALLQKLIDRGGEPTVTAKLSSGNFRFDELSAESPIGNRDINFDDAEALATQLGAELMEPTVYASFRGRIALDENTLSWLRTTKEVRKTGVAFGGFQGSSRMIGAGIHGGGSGLRCSLEV